ncbi:MAG: phytoene desaturase [Truepera sp.]|nr:phytoene desaturase [Truepera sp.]
MNAIVIGAGIGGMATAIRLQALGFNTTLLDKLDGPGGRAYVHQAEGFIFDMGPTVITVPPFIEELFAINPQASYLQPDFPALADLTHTRRYVELVPLDPFYRIFFADGSNFDYNNDRDHLLREIERLAPEDKAGYLRFERDAKAIFERGFMQLGFTHFGSLLDLLRVAPDLLRLDAVGNLFRFAKKYFTNPKLQQVFSFETLLVGGNPLSVPAIYTMIHFVERTWGVHFAMGGTGALVRGLEKKFLELGGQTRYGVEAARILVNDRTARGVALANGAKLAADLVVSNADYLHTYGRLLASEDRRWHGDWRLKATRLSMSLFVLYFGFKARGDEGERLAHHNILLSERYEALLKEIFTDKKLPADFAHYLHLPTLTDPSLAPPGHHTAYTLVPVPHNGSGLDWSALGPSYAQKALAYLDEAGYLPGLRERLVYTHFITPDYFESVLNSHLGNAFGPEPVLRQTAFFRPHNRSEDVRRLYLVGASYQPGGGLPSVMMSAKMTTRLIAQDFGLS